MRAYQVTYSIDPFQARTLSSIIMTVEYLFVLCLTYANYLKYACLAPIVYDRLK